MKDASDLKLLSNIISIILEGLDCLVMMSPTAAVDDIGTGAVADTVI